MVYGAVRQRKGLRARGRKSPFHGATREWRRRMARKVQVILSDDLDENVAADETVSFSLDGTNYEIDLSEKNAEELRNAFSRYVQAARKVGRGREGTRPPRRWQASRELPDGAPHSRPTARHPRRGCRAVAVRAAVGRS